MKDDQPPRVFGFPAQEALDHAIAIAKDFYHEVLNRDPDRVLHRPHPDKTRQRTRKFLKQLRAFRDTVEQLNSFETMHLCLRNSRPAPAKYTTLLFLNEMEEKATELLGNLRQMTRASGEPMTAFIWNLAYSWGGSTGKQPKVITDRADNWIYGEFVDLVQHAPTQAGIKPPTPRLIKKIAQEFRQDHPDPWQPPS